MRRPSSSRWSTLWPPWRQTPSRRTGQRRLRAVVQEWGGGGLQCLAGRPAAPTCDYSFRLLFLAFLAPAATFKSAADDPDSSPLVCSRKYRRTVFDFKKWKEHRSTDRYVRHMGSMLSSRMVRGLAPPLLYIFGVAAFVCAYNTAVQVRPGCGRGRADSVLTPDSPSALSGATLTRPRSPPTSSSLPPAPSTSVGHLPVRAARAEDEQQRALWPHQLCSFAAARVPNQRQLRAVAGRPQDVGPAHQPHPRLCAPGATGVSGGPCSCVWRGGGVSRRGACSIPRPSGCLPAVTCTPS